MSPYYGPDESKTDIQLERNFVAGDVVVGTGYGIQLVLYTTCAAYLWKRRRNGRQPLLLLAYMTCMLLIESLFVAVQARTVQMIYIDNRNYPGGPWQFFLASQSDPINVIFYATLFLLTFLSDLLVLWRCWVIWSASGSRMAAWAAIAFPSLVLLASFAMGTLWTLQSSQPTLSMYSALPMAYGTAYYAISLGANILLTLLITVRLLAYRRTLRAHLPPDLARHYGSLGAVVVESAALYSVFATLFLATYAAGDPTNQVWLAVASAAQQVANLLIIYRLAEGSAWRRDTLMSKTAPIHFRSAAAPSTHVGSFHIAAPRVQSSDDDGSSAERSKEGGGGVSKEGV
ncbi:hypothetical protein B0H15DRAFT_547168 [Mycena belliarum]|uniref:Uncharacterized protein n=1 Tax=Mycena belliarum TaxID=1033014 RepID=A0AAD6XZL6_9AGAR|nr:hypothetical protein B0H15DRAFT_547168 [Mycena belliae]